MILKRSPFPPNPIKCLEKYVPNLSSMFFHSRILLCVISSATTSDTNQIGLYVILKRLWRPAAKHKCVDSPTNWKLVPTATHGWQAWDSRSSPAPFLDLTFMHLHWKWKHKVIPVFHSVHGPTWPRLHIVLLHISTRTWKSSTVCTVPLLLPHTSHRTVTYMHSLSTMSSTITAAAIVMEWRASAPL